MRTVWKYNVSIHDSTFDLDLPTAATILTVAVQHGMPYLWVEVDNDTSSVETRSFRWVGTNYEVPDNSLYVGTVLVLADTFVFHLYEVHG